jgi:hypothetical protein
MTSYTSIEHFKDFLGEEWVCENHPDKAWGDGEGCCGAAGMPCICSPMHEDNIKQEKTDGIKRAIEVIDHAQEQLWLLHHKVKEYDEELGMKIWEWTLQIEQAVRVLRESK